MPKIVPIVEGDGEVAAVPILLRKILEEMQRWDVQITQPKNAHGCENLKKPGGLERFLQLAYMERDCAAVLILMDADELCAKELAQSFTQRIKTLGTPYPVAIVLPKCEYEAWFLASLETLAGRDLNGRPGLLPESHHDGGVEAVVGVKQWLSRQFPPGRSYKETLDQAPMTHGIDMSLVHDRPRSFRRLRHAVEELLAAIDGGFTTVTPHLAE